MVWKRTASLMRRFPHGISGNGSVQWFGEVAIAAAVGVDVPEGALGELAGRHRLAHPVEDELASREALEDAEPADLGTDDRGCHRT